MSDFNDIKTVTARRDHMCEFCFLPIKKGEKYVSQSGIFDGDFYFCRLHQHCQNMIDSYVEEFGPYDVAFDDVRDWVRDMCTGCQLNADCTQSAEWCPMIIKRFKKPSTYEVAEQYFQKLSPSQQALYKPLEEKAREQSE